MRTSTIGLAAALLLAGIGTGIASTGPVSVPTSDTLAAPRPTSARHWPTTVTS